jgi:hypothetical protein
MRHRGGHRDIDTALMLTRRSFAFARCPTAFAEREQAGVDHDRARQLSTIPLQPASLRVLFPVTFMILDTPRRTRSEGAHGLATPVRCTRYYPHLTMDDTSKVPEPSSSRSSSPSSSSTTIRVLTTTLDHSGTPPKGLRPDSKVLSRPSIQDQLPIVVLPNGTRHHHPLPQSS